MINSLKLDIVRYNKYHRIKRIALILIYVFLITITIFIKVFSFEPLFFKFGLLIILALWAILNLIVVPYNKLGEIIIFKDGNISIRSNTQHELIKINSLKFNYRGYYGKLNEFGVFWTGSWTRDGLQNILVINDIEYHVFLSSIEDKNKTEMIINELHKKGVNAVLTKRKK